MGKRSVTAGGLPRFMLGGAILLWLLAAVVGTMGQSLQGLDREAYFSIDGEPVAQCFGINPDAFEKDPSIGNHFCTPTRVLGPTLPEDVDVTVGDIDWSTVDASDFVETLGQPSLWFTVGVGGSALFMFGAFARATGTIRAGLAASVSMVFLGLLLFPAAFTATIPNDMRVELIDAWKWIIVFYFGSEAAVQAWKISSTNSVDAQGDVPVLSDN